jgi:hypothetical protein
MTASQASPSADPPASSSADVREETVRTVSVQFRLYDKISGIADKGAFKADAPKRGRKKTPEAGEEEPPKSDAYWIYLFQYSHSTKTVVHTHELYVDDLGRYNPIGGRSAPTCVVSKSVVLASSHTRGNERFGVFLYYALLSPFQVPKSRFDHVIPNGVASGAAAKDFISWAQYRGLPLLQFSKQHERLGATVELWTPWLKAAAIADSWDVAYRRFARYCFARHDRQRIVDTIDLLKGHFDVYQCVSRTNIDAFRADVKRDWAPCDAVSAELAKHINGKPFQEMLLDMWEDKSGDALTVLLPWLADCYRAASVKDLLGWVDPRLFSIPIKIENSHTSKSFRRATKALVEINSLLFKALESDKGTPNGHAAIFIAGARLCFRKLFGKEVAWTEFGWNRDQIEDLKRLTIRGDSPAWKWRPGATSFLLAVIWALDSVGTVKAYQALQKDPQSWRARIALIGSCASQLSTTLKIVESVTTPNYVLDARELTRSADAFFGPQLQRMYRAAKVPIVVEEEAVLRAIALERAKTGLLRALRNKVLMKGLGAISGGNDAIGACFDLLDAAAVGDQGSAICFGIVFLGGVLVVGATLAGAPLWLAATGQILELAGLLGAGLLRSSDFEIWMRFCCFGDHAAHVLIEARRPWTRDLTLGQLAASSPGRQLAAFNDLVFEMSADVERVRFTQLSESLQVTAHFTYGVPSKGYLLLRIELVRKDKSVVVSRPLSPWTDGWKIQATNPKRAVGLGIMHEPKDSLDACDAVRVIVRIVLNDGMELYPEDGPTVHEVAMRDIKTKWGG